MTATLPLRSNRFIAGLRWGFEVGNIAERHRHGCHLQNGADQRAFFNVTFARTYMDEQKAFHDTDSFGRDDLLLLAKLADQAHSFICEPLAAQKGEEFPEGSRRG